MKFLIFTMLVIIAITLVIIIFDIRAEFEEFNNGKCLECGGKLKFDYESDDGTRVYECGDCGHMIEVYYSMVDKDYWED